ncbi:MAG: cytochrome-c oxidase, cbb3-type subunit III [Gammaproteobacteria bacterium]
MADFTSGFWSPFIAIVTLASIAACLWLVWAQSRARRPNQDGQVETMGHVWDGDIEEYNNPLPKWWLNLFYITLFWGFAYLLFYPGLGSYAGLLGWTQKQQYEDEVAAAEARYGELYARYQEMAIPVLAEDPDVLSMGRNLFASYCIQCHGSDAGGARGFPNLTDQQWLYGDSPEAIEHSILKGRNGVMPGWADIIGEDGVEKAADYVEHLAGRDIEQARVEAGQATYNQTCVACHGAEGKGNPMLGAPDLTNDIWLYGGTRKAIVESIAKGRMGKMPPHEAFLGAAKVRVLAAYVYSFTQDDKAAP